MGETTGTIVDAIQDAARYAFLRGAKLREALYESRVLDALLDRVGAPGSRAQWRSMPRVEKLRAIEHAILQRTQSNRSGWFECHPLEVLSAMLYETPLSDSYIFKLFDGVSVEGDLKPAIKQGLLARGLTPVEEVPLGACVADVVGARVGSFDTIVAVEAKNDLRHAERALYQLHQYGAYADDLWFACTPWFAMDYTSKHSDGDHRWQPNALATALAAVGAGLLIVERNECFGVAAVRKPRADDRHRAMARDSFQQRLARAR